MKQLFNSILSLSWLVLCISVAQGQFDFKYAPEPLSSLYNQFELFETNKGIVEIYKYKDANNFWRIRALKTGPDSTITEQLRWTQDGSEGNYLGSWLLADKIYVLFRINKTSDNKAYIYGVELGQETLRLNDHATLLWTASNSAQKQESVRLMQINHKTLAIVEKQPGSTKKQAIFTITCFNEALHETYTTDLKVHASFKKLALSDIQQIKWNKNQLSVLLKIYKNKLKKEEKKTGSRYHFCLLGSNQKGDQILEEHLKILQPQDSAYIISAHLCETAANQLHCYGNYRQNSGICGLFKLLITSDSISKMQLYSYPMTLINATKSDFKLIKQRKELALQHYKITKLLPQQNQDLLLIAEQQYTKVYDDKSAGRQRLHWAYNSMVIALNNDSIKWVQIIPKKQQAGGTDYNDVHIRFFGHCVHEDSSYLYLMYNDYKRNNKSDTKDKLVVLDGNMPSSKGVRLNRIDKKRGTNIQIYIPFNKDIPTALIPQNALSAPKKSVHFTAISKAANKPPKLYYQLTELNIERAKKMLKENQPVKTIENLKSE